MKKSPKCETKVRAAMLASFRAAWPDYLSPGISQSAVGEAAKALKSGKGLACTVLSKELVDNEGAVLLAFGVTPSPSQVHSALVCLPSEPQVTRHTGEAHSVVFLRKGRGLICAANG